MKFRIECVQCWFACRFEKIQWTRICQCESMRCIRLIFDIIVPFFENTKHLM